MPRPFRDPRTQQEFSDMYGVGHDTLARWKQDPDFVEDVNRAFDLWTFELVPEMAGAIFNAGMKGNDKSQALFMKYFSKRQNPDRVHIVNEDRKEIGPNLAEVLLERAKARALKQNPTHANNPDTINGTR